MHSRAKKTPKRTQSVLWETCHLTTHPKVKSVGATDLIHLRRSWRAPGFYCISVIHNSAWTRHASLENNLKLLQTSRSIVKVLNLGDSTDKTGSEILPKEASP